jgi:hypothetical protein
MNDQDPKPQEVEPELSLKADPSRAQIESAKKAFSEAPSEGTLRAYLETVSEFGDILQQEFAVEEIARNETLKPKPTKDALRKMIKVLVQTQEENEKEERRKEREQQKAKDLGSDEDHLDFMIADNEMVRWSPREVDLVTIIESKDGEIEWTRSVILGHLRPIVRLRIDDEIYYSWQLDKELILGNVEDILLLLTQRGYVVFRQRAQDVVSALASGMVQETLVRHAVFGVYDDGNYLALCDAPLPVRDEQIRVWDAIKPHVSRDATREELKAYIEIFEHWHQYEILPAIGAALSAPFALMLRREHILVADLFLFGPPDIGKTLVEEISTEKMFGVEYISGEGIESQYRLMAHLDSVGLALGVDEADKLKEGLWPVIKASAESSVAGKRGQKDLTMLTYHSRAVLLMTGNALPTQSEPVLKRLIMPRFDSSARQERKAKATLVRGRVDDLAPIGFWLIRNYLAKHCNKNEFLETIRRWSREIETERTDWESPKRAQAWAVLYLGLKVLEEGCAALEVEWRIPTIQEFVRDVVNPVEQSTWDARRLNWERFSDWLDFWFTRNTRLISGTDGRGYEILGEDQTWKYGLIDVEGEGKQGVWVTGGILDEYNKQAQPGNRISSLKDLSIETADATGIPYDCVLEKGRSQAMPVNFGGRTKRAAFVPYSLSGEKRKENDAEKEVKIKERKIKEKVEDGYTLSQLEDAFSGEEDLIKRLRVSGRITEDLITGRLSWRER